MPYASTPSMAGLRSDGEHQERLQHLGVQVLDLLPAQLPIALVNRYFDIKRAGRL